MSADEVLTLMVRLVNEWADDNMIISPDSKFTRDVLVREAREVLSMADVEARS